MSDTGNGFGSLPDLTRLPQCDQCEALKARVKELSAMLLREYEIQQAECLSDSSASDCDMCGGCFLTQRIAVLKGVA